jgi:hypothetical protein
MQVLRRVVCALLLASACGSLIAEQGDVRLRRKSV